LFNRAAGRGLNNQKIQRHDSQQCGNDQQQPAQNVRSHRPTIRDSTARAIHSRIKKPAAHACRRFYIDETKNYRVVAGDDGAAGAIALGGVGRTGAVVVVTDVVVGVMVLTVVVPATDGNAASGLLGVRAIFACASGIKTLSIAIMLPLLALIGAPSDFAF